MEIFQEKLQQKLTVLLRTKVGEVVSELKRTKELIDTGDKFYEISDVLLDTLLEYPEIQKVER